MSKRDTCEHGRPECECAVSRHLEMQWMQAERSRQQLLNTRVAFEHDFVRLEQQARAAHAFFEAGMFDQAVEWLGEIVNVSRGLRAAMSPCEHNWKIGPDGELRCTKGCTYAQTR